jgi:adenylate kinase
MKYRSILLFGAPGSGKGTQGKVLGQVLGFVHVSTGDLFRGLDRQSEMGKVFIEYSSRGLLVPDDFTISLWRQSMQQWAAAGRLAPDRDILVMDGIPRNVRQAELLSDAIQVDRIIVLEVTDMDEMVRRLKGRALKEGRRDDADEAVIRNRMEVYERETRPVLDFYPQDRIVRIDALQTPIRVLRDIAGVVAEL